MAEESFKRKLTAILSADVEGYSRLMGEDEDATIRTLTTYRELMSTLIQKHRGRVVDSPGDNLLAEFLSVVDAVRCAVEIQEELRVRNAELPENRRMQFRIGINLGDVVEEQERIYGDGVNIAARVEGLAEGGGICISGTVYDSIKNKLTLSYESIGEHTVKNIKEPVRVYRMRVGPEAAAPVVKEKKAMLRKWQWAALAVLVILILGAVAIWNFYFRPPPIEPASVEKMAYTLPDKPSIAVLPFVNMSSDPEQEYIADGISESIITALCKVPQMFVIARTSTSVYKGRSVKIQQVSQELGVRYVLEGSVQKTGDQIRVTAQLIDAITGHHLWADRYDRDIQNFFDLLDEIAKKVAIELQVKLTEGDTARMSHKTNNFEAWGYAIEAYGLLQQSGKESVAKARELCEKAVRLDPEYAYAWGAMGAAHVVDAQMGYTESPDKSFKLAVKCIDKSLKLDETLPCSTAVKGRLHMMQGEFEQAIAVGERAIALAPSFDQPLITLSIIMHYAGRFEESIALAKKAMRLNPRSPAFLKAYLASSYFYAGRYEEALDAQEEVLERAQKGEFSPFIAHLEISATYMELGREKEARAHAAEVLKINPKVSLESLQEMSLYKNAAHPERFLSALRKAGIPETPPLPLPDKPSIAVLPFVNMSGDPEQEYFSDGITEEIITALSKTPKLFVIARTSSFKYKGKDVDLRTVGRELGVRYVLEGSVRKAEDRVRITAQLIDAQSGNHLWAERYDRDLKDIFAIQDEVTLKVITALQVKLSEGEEIRIYAKGTQNLEAYLRFLEGLRHLNQVNREGTAHARQFLKDAITLDPEYPAAYTFLAMTHLRDIVMMVTNSPKESLAKAIELAKKAIELDESLADAHALLGYLFTMRRQHDKGVAQAEQAIALNPNSASAYHWYGMTLNYAGRHDEAIKAHRKAIRLNPFPPTRFYFCLAFAYRDAKRYEEAIAASKKALEQAPNCFFAHTCLASCYALMGRQEDAHAEMEEAVRINPRFSLARTAKMIMYKYEEDREFLIESFRKAGLK